MDRSNKRGSITGVLVVDKPVGMTSMDVVAVVRGKARGARTGHAGTLDPLASGVLVVALGRATKSLERIMGTDKRYATTVDLGAFTETDDLEAERVEVPVAEPPGEPAVRDALAALTGRIMQVPPARSAVKVGGRRAYAMSRRGETVELEARPVEVHAIELLRYEWPRVELDIRCGKGTYVRSLARDLGRALGTGGHCAALRRTAVGPFTEEMARSLDELPEPLRETDLMRLEEAVEMLGGGG